MKTILIAFILCLCTQLSAHELQSQCSKEEFRAKKEAYLRKQAGLTLEEAKEFFPIYFKLNDLKKEINRKAWKAAKKGREEGTTEAEYENILNGFIDASKETNELDKVYLKKFQEILSNEKIYKVLKAEIKFNRNMLKILNEE